jgi:hypothetical protein
MVSSLFSGVFKMAAYNIRNDAGEVSSTVVADAAFMLSQYPEGNYTQVPETPPAPLPDARRITKLALAVRLGFTIEVALETAATTDPEVRVLLGRDAKATFIDLDDPRLEYGLRVFIDKGLMTAAQVTEVLGAAVLESERYT